MIFFISPDDYLSTFSYRYLYLDSLWIVPSDTLPIFIKGLFVVFLLIYSYFKIQAFYWLHVLQLVPHTVASVFIILIASFNEPKFSILINYKLSVFSVVVSAFRFFRNVCLPSKLWWIVTVMTLMKHATLCPHIFDVPPIKIWNLFLHLLSLGWPCDLFWPNSEMMLCNFWELTPTRPFAASGFAIMLVKV